MNELCSVQRPIITRQQKHHDKHQRPQFTQPGFERSPVVLLAGKLIERRDKGMQQAFVREAAQVGCCELKSHRAVDFEEELAFVLVPARPWDSLC